MSNMRSASRKSTVFGKIASVQTPIETEESLQEALESESLLVIDVYAEWCGPCQSMGPSFLRMSADYDLKERNVQLLIANSGDFEKFEKFRGCSRPIYLFYFGGDIRRIVHGADAPLIEAYIQEFLDSNDLGVNISPADNFKYTLRPEEELSEEEITVEEQEELEAAAAAAQMEEEEGELEDPHTLIATIDKPEVSFPLHVLAFEGRMEIEAWADGSGIRDPSEPVNQEQIEAAELVEEPSTETQPQPLSEGTREESDTPTVEEPQEPQLTTLPEAPNTPVDLLQKDNYGETVLNYAVGAGHIEMVKFLLDRGVPVNLSGRLGATAAHVAAKSGNVAMIELLGTHHADFAATTETGHTVVELCPDQESRDVARDLQNASIDKSNAAAAARPKPSPSTTTLPPSEPSSSSELPNADAESPTSDESTTPDADNSATTPQNEESTVPVEENTPAQNVEESTSQVEESTQNAEENTTPVEAPSQAVADPPAPEAQAATEEPQANETKEEPASVEVKDDGPGSEEFDDFNEDAPDQTPNNGGGEDY